MKTVGPLSVAIDAKKPFDYFDKIRKITSTAREDLLFVDPYMGADFVSQYLPADRKRSGGPAAYIEATLGPATCG